VSLKRKIGKFRPEIIYHCAAYGAYADLQHDILGIARANIIGSLNLLTSVMETGFECFVNTGSSNEYGVCHEPMREEMLPAPPNAYSASKVSMTMFCSALARAHGIPVMTLRVFSPYGPMDDRRRFIPKAIDTLLAGNDMSLSQGNEARDYFFIDDLIDLYVQIPTRKSQWRGEVINAGSGHQTSVKDVITAIVGLTGSESRLLWGSFPNRNFDNTVLVADCSKAFAEFKWSPRIGLIEGLKRTTEWHLGPNF